MKKHKRIVLAYNGHSTSKSSCHRGLGITALNIQKSLLAVGYHAEIWPIAGGDALEHLLHSDQDKHRHPVTHVVVQAPWIPAEWFQRLARNFVRTKFVCTSHSNVGFLQAESRAISLMREYADLSLMLPNFKAGGNSLGFCNWMRFAYGRPTIYLPNMYFIDPHIHVHHRPLWNGGILRIGAFGAGRTYKNFQSAVAAAVEIAHELKAVTEIYVNKGRTDGHGDVVYRAMVATTENLPAVSLKLVPWCEWPHYRKVVSTMHLLLQPSHTESFNNVTADGILEGVPSVVSSAIRFAPKNWTADADDVLDIARKGRHLLGDVHAANDGIQALKQWNEAALPEWQKFILS